MRGNTKGNAAAKFGFVIRTLEVLDASSSAEYISAADLARVLKRATTQTVIDATAKTVQMDRNDVAINNARRSELGPVVLHLTKSEVYYVTEGTAVLLTGGTLVNPQPTAGGDTVTGSSIEGGKGQKIGVGDVVVIPAGTPHAFSAIYQAPFLCALLGSG